MVRAIGVIVKAIVPEAVAVEATSTVTEFAELMAVMTAPTPTPVPVMVAPLSRAVAAMVGLVRTKVPLVVEPLAARMRAEAGVERMIGFEVSNSANSGSSTSVVIDRLYRLWVGRSRTGKLSSPQALRDSSISGLTESVMRLFEMYPLVAPAGVVPSAARRARRTAQP